jgi:NAD(P)-dependent dehydrogenase (short-subunit alcohol dehydrogenase family)
VAPAAGESLPVSRSSRRSPPRCTRSRRASALDLAPVRVNLIAPGFVDTPLSASLLGGDLNKRREELRAILPIGRVVGPADVAALAVHLMINTAVTGATYDIDGGQQLVP